MRKTLAVCMILLLIVSAASCRKKNTGAPAAPAITAAPAADAPEQYAISFTADTLDGEMVTESFFGQYDLTMVNVWASWCGPCRSELGELGELYGKLPENVGFLSVTVDTADALQDAKALLEHNGCAFPCLDGDGAGLMQRKGLLSGVMYLPTTIFFDRSGNQVGQWIVGVPQGKGAVSDVYMAEIQARLDLLGK